MHIARAEPEAAAELTAVAFAAKRHGGYPEAWIQRWRDTLTITPDYVVRHATFVAIVGETGAIVGFSAVGEVAGASWIDHGWVLPAAMGRGIGRGLFAACEEEVRKAGAAQLRVEADPHAEEFYSRMGMRTYGRTPAAMDGVERFLPLMAKTLA